MTTTSSLAIICALKSIFSRHGIPEVVRSDNGPQYASQEFANFAESYGFRHTTSSPYYAQSNGQAERMVQTVKRLLQRSGDPYAALLSYRSTPFPWCNLSPAELCMGRRLRTSVPQTTGQLVPAWSYLAEFKRRNGALKRKQKEDFDRRHGVRDQPEIPDDSEVWITSGATPVRGRISASADTPRSYTVETPTGQVRRNRQHLNMVPESSRNSNLPEQEAPPPSRIMTRTQTGIVINPPERFG